MQEELFQLLFERDDITWQSMIYELVRSERMDPWDVDISLLAQKFLEMLKKLKEMDFRIPGKIILAAAILLKLKSNKLVGEDISELDRLIASSEQTEEDFYEELEAELTSLPSEEEKYSIIPRVPQPRKRKVSVFDLVDALNKALEVKNRRIRYSIPPPPKVEPPKKVVDISIVIQDIYKQIRDYYLKKRGKKLTFSQLLPSNSREDKVYTFVPLLHLSNQRKIDLYQEEHFGEIEIELLKQGVKVNTA